MICGSVFVLKNLTRVTTNLSTNYYQAPWPRIYENKDNVKNLNSSSNRPQEYSYEYKDNLLKIYYINKLNYWTSDRSILCMYNSGPCAQSGKNFDNLKLKKLIIIIL